MHARLHERLRSRLEGIARENRWKDYREFASGPGARIETADSRSLLLFTSSDYLGLACDARVIGAAQAAVHLYGAGTASARFISGTTTIHRTLEREIAQLCGTESALTFTSGWSANLGLLASLPESGDLILSDTLNHASLIDGARLAAKGVERIVVPHADLRAMERELTGWRGPGIAFCVTDGVFSMEGSLAPLADLVDLTQRHGAVLIVDDAHGLGVVGKTGRGTAEATGVLGQIDVITGSLGKALGGVAGGFVAAAKPVIGLLEQCARAMLFTTAMTPAAAGASHEAIRILRDDPQLVTELQDKVETFVAALGQQPHARSAIVPLLIGASSAARAVARKLENDGIFVSCLSHPVVPEGQARLRFQVSRLHRYEDLTYCAAACARAISLG